MTADSAPGGAGAARTPLVAPDPELLTAVLASITGRGISPGAVAIWRDGDHFGKLSVSAAATAGLRATGEWLAERLEERARSYPDREDAVLRIAIVATAVEVRRLCGVPAPGAPGAGVAEAAALAGLPPHTLRHATGGNAPGGSRGWGG